MGFDTCFYNLFMACIPDLECNIICLVAKLKILSTPVTFGMIRTVIVKNIRYSYVSDIACCWFLLNPVALKPTLLHYHWFCYYYFSVSLTALNYCFLSL